ncbi:MAG TPA: tetratricopeptide repeat protein [Chthoniobacteraceae bacterium]|jgi:TolA-binding protein
MLSPRNASRPLLPHLFACLLAFQMLAPISGAQAPNTEANKIAGAYNAAMQAFGAQNWAAAISGLEEVLAVAVEDKAGQFQSIYFTLGAAYFNSSNHPKAIEVFTKYLAKYPKAEKATEVKWALAQASFANKSYEAAAPLFEALAAVPAYREQAISLQARCYKELQQPEKAIAVLEKLIAPEIKTTAQANGALELAGFYAEANKPEAAVALLSQLQAKAAIVENLVSLNAVAIKLGDEFVEKKAFKEAIDAYRAVRPREEVLRMQNLRIQMMDRRAEFNLRSAGGNPNAMAQAQMANQQLRTLQAEQKELLAAFEKLPDFASALLLRQARSWYEWDRKWEALVVYDRILNTHAEGAEREAALYGMIVAYAELSQAQRCQQVCEAYLKEFPQGANVGAVGYVSGAVALQAQDYAGAETFFGRMMDKVPDSAQKEDMRYLLANARFAQGKYEEATKDYQKYIADYPTGRNVEEANYRLALVKVFAGEYEKAMAALGAYLQQYPTGVYVSDARYRLAVCKYAASLYEEVQKDCEAWLKAFEKDPITGEVLALLADSLAAQNKVEEAIPIYRNSFQVAATDEVINYSLFEASKHLQKLGKWADVAALFEGFVKERPEHSAVVAAMYWIGKARARQGQTEEAKAFMVENLKRYIAEPRREAVEQLLTQLAQLCARRPKPAAPAIEAVLTTAPSGTPTATPAMAAATPAPLPPHDAVGELDRQLKPLEESANGTTKARLLFARAELARALKKPADAEQFDREIAERFKPEDLSPVLLAQAGDYLRERGNADRASEFYHRLMDDYVKSDYLDFAYVGLGEIAFAKKDFPKALSFFTDATEKIASSMKTKEATLGQAKTLLELQRYPEAKKLFEQVASMREWRGESTAFAVFSLGEIEARQARFPEAIAHYRRVFVAYQKYLPWVARSYLRAAESFEKMGKRQDAIENLREMLRNEKLEKLPETQEARRKLQEWGAPA